MARRKPIRGMGIPHRVASCKHGRTQKEKDNARCRCKWFARFTNLEGKQDYGTWDDYDSAYDALLAIYQERKRRQGQLSTESLIKKGSVPTCADLYPHWLKTKYNRRKPTRDNYESRWRCHVEPKFGNRKVTEITWVDVSDWIAEMSDNISNGVIEQCVSVLRGIMKIAKKEGWISENPAEEHHIESHDPKERYAPTPAEIHLIASLIDPRYRLLIYLMGGAGLRLGEALAATSDIILDESTIRIRIQWTDTDFAPLKHCRKGQYRDIPLDPILLAEIRRHMREFGIAEGELFFPSPINPSRPIASTTAHEHIRKAVNAAGLASKMITAHNFRHAFATHGIQNGISLAEMSKILGHKSIQVTYKYYFHLVKLTWSTLRAKINRFLSIGAPEDLDGVNAITGIAIDDEIARLEARLATLKKAKLATA